MTEKQLIKKTVSEHKAETKRFETTVKECKTVEQLKDVWQIRQYITPATNKKKLSYKDLKFQILKTYNKRSEKSLDKKVLNIQNIFAAGEISEIRLSIEWKKNSMWGSNPTCTARLFGAKFEYLSSGSVGGCGYDKGSQSFANCLNQSFAVRKLLLVNSKKLENIYGTSRGFLNGGVGVSCYFDVFKACGFKMVTTASGKTFDAYNIKKI